MFKNTGSKLQKLALIEFICGIIASVISAYIFGFAEEQVAIGITLLISGPIISYINALFTYGFGSIVDATENIQNIDHNVYTLASNEYETVSKNRN